MRFRISQESRDERLDQVVTRGKLALTFLASFRNNSKQSFNFENSYFKNFVYYGDHDEETYLTSYLPSLLLLKSLE